MQYLNSGIFITAVYNPKSSDNISGLQTDAIGKRFTFQYVYTIDEDIFYDPCDINYPDSRPVKKTDLSDIQELENEKD